MLLKDITLSGGAPEPCTSRIDYFSGKEGTLVMVNGQVNPVLKIQPGEVRCWKIVNASNARFSKLSLEGHQLQVIGTEGGLLALPCSRGGGSTAQQAMLLTVSYSGAHLTDIRQDRVADAQHGRAAPHGRLDAPGGGPVMPAGAPAVTWGRDRSPGAPG